MHPIIFSIPTPWGPVPLYSYGLMLGLSFVTGWYLVNYFGGKKQGIDPDLMSGCFLATAISAMVGARVLYILTNLDEFDSPLRWFAMRSGGLVAYGGFLGGLVGSAVYMRIKKLPLLPWADAAAPALGSGLMLTRLGCYMYGCDFGKRLPEGSTGLLASLGTFPRWADGKGAPAWNRHVSLGEIGTDAAASLPVHPTQLYESLVGAILLAVALLVWRKRQFKGQVILVVAAAYTVARWMLETMRDDPERGFYFGFSTSQLISMLLLPLVGFAYYRLWKRAKTEPQLACAGGGDVPFLADDGDPTVKAKHVPTRVRKVKKRR